MRVTVVHPDLGIGGAERLVLDAAKAFQAGGHQVRLVTNRYSAAHAFDDSKSFDIRTVDVFPRSIFGRCMALCAYIRMCLAALYACLALRSDLIFCDSISACLVVFRLFRLIGLCKAPIIFYCHFPDLLLTQRKGVWKSAYRCFIDWLEGWTIGMADLICVNSNFTKRIVQQTFPHLGDSSKLHVLYPTLNTEQFDQAPRVNLQEFIPVTEYRHLFVSINRYERKKNIRLAIDAFAQLKTLLPQDVYRGCVLVVAGGYDRENEENLLHYRELKDYAVDVGISTKQSFFLRSPPDDVKIELLRQATAVLYTPSNEHFGIVPIESMYMKSCTIAVNSGGPKESIEHGVSGFLVDPEPEQFAGVMVKLVTGEINREKIGVQARQRVEQMFTLQSFASELDRLVKTLQ